MAGGCTAKSGPGHAGLLRPQTRLSWRGRQAAKRESMVGKKGDGMKIAVTATSTDISSALDLRFGRARYFIVVDTETNEAVAHDNSQNLNAAQGAGIQSAETVVRLGAEAVVSGNVGPKAFRALKAAGVKMFLAHEGTVAEAISKFKAGELKEAASANVEGHW